MTSLPSMHRHDAQSADAQRESYARVFAAEYDHIYWTLRRHGVGAAEAEELVQEVFLVLWRRRHEVTADRSLRPWLAAIAFHLAAKHQVKRRREQPGVDEELPDLASLPDEGLAAEGDRLLAQQAIARLPERHRVVLVLHELDEIPVRTLAVWWGVPLFTAYTRVRAARHAFARAVIELSRGAGSAPHVPASVDALLALERRPGPAPEPGRRRVRGRLAALVVLPEERWPDRDGHRSRAVELLARPPAAPASMLPFVALAVSLLVGTFGFALLASARGSLASSRPTATVPAEAAAAAGARRSLAKAGVDRLRVPRSLPVFEAPRPDESERARGMALARGLVGYWSFDPGAPTRDTSGNHFDCQIRQLKRARPWGAERDGGTAHFAGAGWLECPQPPLAGRTAVEMTVAVWVTPSNLRQHHRAVVARAMSGGSGELFFLGFGGDKLILRSTPWRARISWAFPGSVGHWVHLAFTHASDGWSRLYVDGVEVGSAHGPPDRQGAVEAPLVVGAGVKPSSFRDGLPASRFAGGVDQLAVYDRALPPEEIAWLAAGTPPSPQH